MTLTSDLVSRKNLAENISFILFDTWIQNLVYGFMLGWWYIYVLFFGHITLTYGLVSRIIVSGAYILYFLR